MEVRKRSESGLSGLRTFALFFLYISILLFPSFAFADTEAAVASRVVNGGVLYYSTLYEAFAAAGGTSLDNPDEIALLADVVLDEPIVIESGKHLRLVAGDGGRTITRGANIDYPLFWIRADDASFTLGAPAAEGSPAAPGSLTVDGGYCNEPSIEARAPLVAINGQRARLVIYDGVTLQNNYNRGAGSGTSLYENGAAVFVRTRGDVENLAAFIMKGGVIRGNINNTQNVYAYGGGVLVIGLGLFVMEGGEMRDNTAFFSGGGFAAGSRASFKKTGGIIYGKDAPKGLRNTALNGIGEPRSYGHALNVNLPEDPTIQFRDDTVGEDETLSYEGDPSGRNGVFGEGEKWERPHAVVPRYFFAAGFALVLLGGVLVFSVVRSYRKRLAAISASGTPDPALEEILQNLTPGEKEVFDLLLTERSLKEIAGDLNITYSGANFHTQKIYRKFAIQSRTELFVLFHKSHSVNED